MNEDLLISLPDLQALFCSPTSTAVIAQVAAGDQEDRFFRKYTPLRGFHQLVDSTFWVN